MCGTAAAPAKIHGVIDRILSDLKLARFSVRSRRPSRFCLDHSHCLVLAPATLAALPSTRAIPARDVFYVAYPSCSTPLVDWLVTNKISTTQRTTSNLMGMSGRIFGIVLTLLWLHSPIVFGQAHFKRFPETVTNNGAYVLGWGIKDDPAGSVDSKTEIVADGPEQLDLDSDRFEPCERVEDYLVDPATGKIVATIPNFTYYAGSEGVENHFTPEL